ncbi:hypothetical protein VTK73DRAFT_5896 [Phialemonium thermophilum]|uniref:UspA domain-containing protein n=1 Tax=Phialemonium thermophilum TaxID=223376 RepID=A0ABR3WLM5_9PEZI
MSPKPDPAPPGASQSRATANSNDEDISPKTVVENPQSKAGDYFSSPPPDQAPVPGRPDDKRKDPQLLSPWSASSAAGAPPVARPSSGDAEESLSRTSSQSVDGHPSESRKSSAASVSFRPPQNPALPQGHQRRTDGKRLRASSPVPVRFKRHISFDNLPVGEATKNNPSSFTLNARHQGYHPNRRSRTFMAGVDEHAYSDYALAWLLENLADDGDEVVCVRVVEAPVRAGEKNYQAEAQRLLKDIQEKNTRNLAISIVLEYSVGKLHATFQQLIQLYQPSMLIVGTRGRSLGGIQGLVNSRNSFSKYCLQYSPVPVIVVRPDEQRRKKKEKRTQDPTRQSYAALFAATKGKHEADSDASSIYDLEVQLSPDEEAHRVAAAMGLPAAWDPTIKPYSGSRGRSRASAPTSPTTGPTVNVVSTSGSTTKLRSPSPPPVLASNDSGDDESGEEDEFEAVSGQQALEAQKHRLHQMEVGEAAALLKSGSAGATEEEDEEEDEGGNGGPRAAK